MKETPNFLGNLFFFVCVCENYPVLKAWPPTGSTKWFHPTADFQPEPEANWAGRVTLRLERSTLSCPAPPLGGVCRLGGAEGVFFPFCAVKCVKRSYSWEWRSQRRAGRNLVQLCFSFFPFRSASSTLTFWPPHTHTRLGLHGSPRNPPHTPETTILSYIYLYEYCICIIETGKTSETETCALACFGVAGRARASSCRWCSFK